MPCHTLLSSSHRRLLRTGAGWVRVGEHQCAHASPPGKARSIPFCGKTGARENRHKGVIMSTSENVEIAKNGYAAFAAGDLAAVLSIFDDDIEFVLLGNSAVSGTYRGT